MRFYVWLRFVSGAPTVELVPSPPTHVQAFTYQLNIRATWVWGGVDPSVNFRTQNKATELAGECLLGDDTLSSPPQLARQRDNNNRALK